MKYKVGTAVAYNQRNPSPLPHANIAAGANANQVLSADKNQAVNRMNQGPNIRPSSRMRANNSHMNMSANKPISKIKSRLSNDGASDDDYEEDQWDKNAEDDGVNEMEKIRNAMNRDKMKADKFKEQQQFSMNQQEASEKYKFQGANRNNPLQVQRNLDGFTKQRGIIVAEQEHNMAANRQQVRAKELRELIQLSQEEQFNMFEMVPQTPQDIYRNKLQSEVIKT